MTRGEDVPLDVRLDAGAPKGEGGLAANVDPLSERQRGRLPRGIVWGDSVGCGTTLSTPRARLKLTESSLRLRTIDRATPHHHHELSRAGSLLPGRIRARGESATDTLAALPADWVNESLGLPAPASV
jgi:hypothetical protein